MNFMCEAIEVITQLESAKNTSVNTIFKLAC